MIYKKYSEEEAAKRIFCTTDKAKGTLKELADDQGYETFVVPDDVAVGRVTQPRKSLPSPFLA